MSFLFLTRSYKLKILKIRKDYLQRIFIVKLQFANSLFFLVTLKVVLLLFGNLKNRIRGEVRITFPSDNPRI